MPKKLIFISTLIICIVGLVTYYPSLSIGFVGDEWGFLRTAGTLSLTDYLISYFNPLTQSYWYRPMQGVQYLIGYTLFQGNAAGYHWIHILLHLANAGLLFGLVTRFSGKWRIGLVAALIFATLSTYGWAVLWPADSAPVETFFYLTALWNWWGYLHVGNPRNLFLTFIIFVCALWTRESSVILLPVLFLMDRLLVRQPVSRVALIERYAPFFVVWLVYLGIALNVKLHSSEDYGIYRGYFIGVHIISNLIQYLSRVIFPWGLPSPVDYLALAVAVALIGYLTVKRSRPAMIFLVIVAGLTIAPYVPYASFGERYTYVAMLVSAVFYGWLFAWVRTLLTPTRLYGAVTCSAICFLLVGNSWEVADKAAGLADLSRFGRTPLRTIAQHHPTLPEDTYLYFINPSGSTVDLSGMFFMRYGAGVSVRGTDLFSIADLRSHRNTIVCYTDEQGDLREQSVKPDSSVWTTPKLPAAFGSIGLDGFELASDHVKHGDAVVVILYWRASARIEKDFTVFAHLVNQMGQTVASVDSQPQAGSSPTSTWITQRLLPDGIVLPIDESVPPGEYKLEIGLYFLPTQERLVVDRVGDAPVIDSVVIEPLRIDE